jgi:hypothetical protein
MEDKMDMLLASHTNERVKCGVGLHVLYSPGNLNEFLDVLVTETLNPFLDSWQIVVKRMLYTASPAYITISTQCTIITVHIQPPFPD